MNRAWSAIALRVAIVLATAAALWLTSARLRLSADLTPLFPNRGDAAALARYARVFGSGELALVLVRGDSPDDVASAATEVASALREKASVVRVLDRAPEVRGVDPTRAWIWAGPRARERLAAALTPEGMRARLAETRAMLLAPGASGAEEWLAKDPLRLASMPWEDRGELGAGVRTRGDGAFVADDGRARLVIVQARGNAFDGAAAAAFVDDAAHASRGSRVTLELTGGHAIARATERMLRRDLTLTSVLSLLLASLSFLVTFRRARALVAVLPPLALGTLWTTGLAAAWGEPLSVLSIAFAAVVVGVGVDTGVHVYAALLEGRRRGLSPHDAARYARKETWRPTLTAAIVAGLAFGSLALSQLDALGQLGILCGMGEVLTAIAILVVTPEIGALLERGVPPVAHSPRFLAWIASLTATRRRATIALALCALPLAVLAIVGPPRVSDAIVAIRPRGLAPLVVQDEVYARFGGRTGQWIVLDVDADEARARERADAVAEAVDREVAAHDVESYDALSTYAPATRTQETRLAARDALDLPRSRATLATALREAGFDLDACAPALDAFEHPSHELVPTDLQGGADDSLAWVAVRHLARDHGETVVATFVDPTGDKVRDARALDAIRAADPSAMITGYPHLERALRAALAHDLPRIALVAFIVAAIALRTAFKSMRDVVLALLVVVVEIGLLALAMRAFDLRWHAYDALVVPVLIGITLDESMFLLHAAGRSEEAMRAQGPLVSATALTTASGFAALLVCRFTGLVDVGAVGALGVIAGLAASLVVVPAGLRVLVRAPAQPPRA
jgi:predicted RND superfamily exporter protein